MLPVRRQISRHASRLRRDATEVEKLMWASLRNRTLGGYKFRRQWTIGPYIVDFVCLNAMLVVELDGGQHTPDKDRVRTAFLEKQGFHVIRFWNGDVSVHLHGVLETILAALIDRSRE